MADDEDKYQAVAASISDGMSIDWDRIEADFRPHDRVLLNNLKVLEGVARHSRPIPGSNEATLDSDEATLSGHPGLELEEPPPARWAHLEKLRMIGKGAFGEVFKAWDPRLDKEVALKLLKSDPDEENPTVTVREGRIMARVRHPNVVTVHGAERREGRVGVWMEFVRGRTLAGTLEEQGPTGASEATLIGLDVCRALAAVHRAGLVHGDIKAENVMREEGGRLVLMDFGISRELSMIDEDVSISGTPLYMAPEVLDCDPASQRSDIYSLGVLLFHLVTREFPVEGKTLREIREAHHAGRVKLLRDVRPGLSAGFMQVVERATAQDPAGRYRTAGEMERALEELLGRTGPHPPPPPILKRLLIATSVAALLAAAIWLAGSLGNYEIQAAFLRPDSSGSMKTLAAGAMVSPGDLIYLEMEASRELYVYVMNEDEKGDAYLLFPMTGFGLENPVSGGRRLRLPDEKVGWEITTAGGRERFLVMASPRRLEEFEKEVASLPQPEPNEPLQLSAAALGKARGAGGLGVPSKTSNAAGHGDIFDMARRLAQKPERTRGVWVRQIEVENPEP